MRRDPEVSALERLRTLSSWLSTAGSATDLQAIRSAVDGAAKDIEASQDVNGLRNWFASNGFPVAFDSTVDSAATAAALGVSPKTLRNWRCLSAGPEWITRRRTPRYSLAAIVTYLTRSPAASRDVP